MIVKKFRILIVDDENSNIKILKEILESDNIVQTSINGYQALEVAKETLPDLILLDIVMPEMDGYTVCRELKSRKDTRNIPIIFITMKNKSEDKTKGFQLGAVDYITKPFNPTIVKARVQTQLDLKLYREHLEKLVAVRTKELEIKALCLKEANTALNILLSHREEA